MKFQMKIMALLIPIISAAIIGMGLWNFYEAREDVYQYTHDRLRTVLTETISNELGRRNQILLSAQMDQVGFFVEAYKGEAIEAIQQRMADGDQYFIIIDHRSQSVIASPDAYSPEILTPLIAKLASTAGSDVIATDGRFTIADRNPLFYTAQAFGPWQWVVVHFIEGEGVHRSIFTIFWRTTIGITVFVSLGILGTFWLLNRYLVKRVLRLKKAAADIADRKTVAKIEIESGDEIGELARSMETMAAILDDHRAKQERLRNELIKVNQQLNDLGQDIEDQIQQRTASQETINLELRRNNTSIKEELTISKEKRNELTVKLSELLMKQSDVLQNHSVVLHKFQMSNDENKRLRSKLTAQASATGTDQKLPSPSTWHRNHGGNGKGQAS